MYLIPPLNLYHCLVLLAISVLLRGTENTGLDVSINFFKFFPINRWQHLAIWLSRTCLAVAWGCRYWCRSRLGESKFDQLASLKRTSNITYSYVHKLVLRRETFWCGWILCGFFAAGDAEVAYAFLVKRSRPSTRRAARASTCFMLSHLLGSLNVVSPNKSAAGPAVVMGVVWTLDKMSVGIWDQKENTETFWYMRPAFSGVW